MSQIIHTGSKSSERSRLLKGIVKACSELIKKSSLDDEAYDLAAFIILSLEMIGSGIEETVIAWEKRDYWIKADKFKSQWSWVFSEKEQLYGYLMMNDMHGLRKATAAIMDKTKGIEPSSRKTSITLWEGAWETLKKKLPGKI